MNDVWEVKNRFRLFANEADFMRQAAATREDGILAAERHLERASGGLGWARDVVGNLCVDNYGNLLQTCNREGSNESYLTPRNHPIGIAISGPATLAEEAPASQGADRPPWHRPIVKVISESRASRWFKDSTAINRRSGAQATDV